MRAWLGKLTGSAAEPAAPTPAAPAAVPSAVPKLNLSRADQGTHVSSRPASAKPTSSTPATRVSRPASAAPQRSVEEGKEERERGKFAASLLSKQQARVILEARMSKLKGRGIGKSWVSQHFVLKADALYYTPDKTYSHKIKKVSLLRAKIGTAQHWTKKDNAFGVVEKDQVHIMCAESEGAMHEWIKALVAVRTALQGRGASQPNPGLALNPRFPDIPSLPPPPSQRKKDDGPDSSPLQQPPAVHTHLTDSEGDEGLQDPEYQDPVNLPRVRAEQEEHPLQPPPAHMRTAPAVARATVVGAAHATAAPDPLALGQASLLHTAQHAALSLNSLRSAMPESEGPSPLHAAPAGSSIGGGRDSEGGAELRERERTRGNRAASLISPARARPPVGAPAPNATPRERESAVRAILVPPDTSVVAFDREMAALEAMGFGDTTLNLQLLAKFQGSVEAVVVELST